MIHPLHLSLSRPRTASQRGLGGALLFLLCAALTVSAGAAPAAGDFFASGPKDRKRLALTFDDGPGPETTRILALLDRHDVKATFFMLGQRVTRDEVTARLVAEAGHEIANHTWNHTNYKRRFREIQDEVGDDAEDVARDELEADIRKTAEAIKMATGRNSALLRMPHGIDRPWINVAAKRAGHILVNWTFGMDWSRKSAEELSREYVDAIRPGAILLFHDGGRRRERTIAAAEAVIIAAKRAGYEIVPAGRLLGLETP